MQVKGLYLMMIGCLLSVDVMAEQQKPLPSDELLEFLGQWEKVDGQWVDPTEMQELVMLEEKQLKGEQDEK